MLLAVIGLIAVVLVAFFFLQSENSSTISEGTKQKVLEVAATNEFVQQLIEGQGFEAKVSRLEANTIPQLRANNVLYDKLPEKTLFQVNYDSQFNGSYVVIVDLEQGKVLKFFRVASIAVG